MYTEPGVYLFLGKFYYLRYPKSTALFPAYLGQTQRTFTKTSLFATEAQLVKPLTTKPSKKTHPEFYI